jgi:hypothetical protein
MKFTLVSALAAGLLSAAPAFSASVTLDFEGLSTDDGVSQFYNGGTNVPGSSGSNPLVSGTNYGASFGLDLLAFGTDLGTTSNLPSGVNAFGAVANTDSAVTVASGFSGVVSFAYSSSADTTVTLFSDVNGGGTALGTFLLAANAQTGCSDTAFCHWDVASLNLGTDVAKSIQFGNTAGLAGFDNLSFTPVPLPAAGWLLVSALGGLGAFRRRRTEA